jgi:DNA-binding response OmpR family regulator
VAPVSAPVTIIAENSAGIRLLLVEDHADTRNVMARVLRLSGFIVTVAASVEAAREAAGQSKFDLLKSDIGLPDGSGYDVMKHVAEKHQLSGIALSGFGLEDDLLKSRNAGFSAHLTKPVDMQALRAAIDEAVRKSRESGRTAA